MNKDFEKLYHTSVAYDEARLMETLDSLYSKYWKLEDDNYQLRYQVEFAMEFIKQHTKGHLPPILSPGKMEDALKALKIRDDYEVYKPTVVVASNNTYKVTFKK